MTDGYGLWGVWFYVFTWLVGLFGLVVYVVGVSLSLGLVWVFVDCGVYTGCLDCLLGFYLLSTLLCLLFVELRLVCDFALNFGLVYVLFDSVWLLLYFGVLVCCLSFIWGFGFVGYFGLFCCLRACLRCDWLDWESGCCDLYLRYALGFVGYLSLWVCLLYVELLSCLIA